ncbi:MAG: phage major capsid protein [Proteobacteria bacterium]|nr:phage major capsid protein [Pseudomonadota bacterium]
MDFKDLDKSQVLGLIAKKLQEAGEKTVDKVGIQKMIDEAISKKPVDRKGDYGDDSAPISGEIQSIIQKKATTDVEKRLQEVNDDVYITSQILKRDPFQMKSWKKVTSEVSELSKAMGTTITGGGAEWIPTGFSADLQDKVRLALKVVALHPRFNMPTNPYNLPIIGADPVAYKVPQSTTEAGEKAPESTPGTKKVQFDAVKLASRVIFSSEIDEDSIIPVLPFLKTSIVNALSSAQENAVINGDTSGVHMDSDITSSYDVRKSWNGYRKLALAGSKVDFGGVVTATLMRSLKASMGKYGVDPNKLAWIVGVSGIIKVMDVPEVKTVDKYGPLATLLSGEIAKFDGIPVVVSEYIRQDLNALGVFDNITKTKTIIALVYTPALMLGDVRLVALKSDEKVETDQIVLVATQRLDFKPFYDASTEPLTAIGYNI